MIKSIFKYLLVAFFVLAGINHFRDPEFYIAIMPPYLPAHEFLVQLSGFTEIAAGLMLAFPKTSKWGAWFIIAHLVVFFTVHFYMIQAAETEFSEIPIAGLWFRVVMQVVFIVWAYWFTKDDASKGPEPAEA